MKYIALNLFLGSHPSQTAMLVSPGRPCIYIKIVWKISPLFMPWVCKHNLLGASCERGGEVCWKLGLRLSGSWVRAGAGGRAASPGQRSQSAPLGRWGPPYLWCPDTCHRQNNMTGIFALLAGGRLDGRLPRPHLEWFCSLCWRCVATRSHASMLILHWFVAGLEKKDTCRQQSTKKTNMTQGFPIDRG